MAAGEFHNPLSGLHKQVAPGGVGGHKATIARQRQAERFGQAVHGIGGEHARAGAAGGAGRAFDRQRIRIAHARIGRRDHGGHEVHLLLDIRQRDTPGFHRPTRDKNDRNVQPHGGHQHAGGDLVAVGNTHQRIRAVRVDHVFHRIGNQLARGQAIQHAAMAHGDPVIHRDGVELAPDPACFFNGATDKLPQILEVNMPRYKLGERIGYRDNGLPKSLSFMPVARHRLRAPAMLRPWVVVRDL